MTIRSLGGGMVIHATCVAMSGRGVLLRGPSGSGKSDLALRLIDQGARLVADDQVRITVRGGRLAARSPAILRGRIEVRGVGILSCDSAADVPLALVVDLGEAPRLPAAEYVTLASIRLPRLRLNPFHASTPVKLRWALNRGSRADVLIGRGSIKQGSIKQGSIGRGVS